MIDDISCFDMYTIHYKAAPILLLAHIKSYIWMQSHSGWIRLWFGKAIRIHSLIGSGNEYSIVESCLSDQDGIYQLVGIGISPVLDQNCTLGMEFSYIICVSWKQERLFNLNKSLHKCLKWHRSSDSRGSTLRSKEDLFDYHHWDYTSLWTSLAFQSAYYSHLKLVEFLSSRIISPIGEWVLA
jgi:hypothetical protein